MDKYLISKVREREGRCIETGSQRENTSGSLKPTLRLGLGKHSPNSSSKKPLFKPRNESTPKRSTSEENLANDTTLSPVISPTKKRKVSFVASDSPQRPRSASDEANNQCHRLLDTTPMKPPSSRYVSRSKDFISASQALKNNKAAGSGHPVSRPNKSTELLSLDDSFFGDFNLDEVCSDAYKKIDNMKEMTSNWSECSKMASCDGSKELLSMDDSVFDAINLTVAETEYNNSLTKKNTEEQGESSLMSQEKSFDKSVPDIKNSTPGKEQHDSEKGFLSTAEIRETANINKKYLVQYSSANQVPTINSLNEDKGPIIPGQKQLVKSSDPNADSESQVGLPLDSPKKMLELQVADSQNYPASIVPMSEKLKLALISNVKKPVTPRPQVPLFDSCKNSPSPVGTSSFTQDINREHFFDLGPFFGLPSKVKAIIQHCKGIVELYPWQVECLSLPAVKERKNLIYALPTSGGKTLVAEILILREVLCRKKNVIFVLPYVSLVQEKVRDLSVFAVALNFLIEEYAAGKGTYPPKKRRWKQSVYVCTIEKSLGLLNNLLELGRLSEVGLIVVDELHLLGESGRGANLEGMLTKVMFSAEPVQIVGMSATIGNLNEIAEFLSAETYTGNFRPVELKEYVKLENRVYSVNYEKNTSAEEMLQLEYKVHFPYTQQMLSLDPDMVAGLVMEVIPTESVLIFCASKKNCENVAILLSRLLPTEDLMEHKKEEKKALFRALVAQGNGSVCPILAKTLPFGVAYHHSGLTADERRLLEEAYLAMTICCICCTSTLAAGVNLPAKRVILRSPYVGISFLNKSRYKQMVGRAGRAGLGALGESFLMCKRLDAKRIGELLMSNMDEANSNLHNDQAQGMLNLVLSAICLGIATTRRKIHALTRCTLLHTQANKLEVDACKLADSCIDALFKLGAVRTAEISAETSVLDINLTIRMSSSVDSDNPLETTQTGNTMDSKHANVKQRVVIKNHTELITSRLGRAALKGSIELNQARVMYEDLRQAQTSFVCISYLHILYLVTPYTLSEQITPVNTIYFRALEGLNKKDLLTSHILGMDDGAMASLMRGQKVKGVPDRVVKRFYVTLMLNDLWEQKSTWEVANKFQISRGFVQSLMTSASAFAACVSRFCEELEEMWCFKDILGNFTQRLAHCCSLELLPLMDLPAVKRGRAKQLYNAGYKSIMDVAKADPSALVREIEPLPIRMAHQIVAAAKMLLLEKVETLREDAADAIEVLAMGETLQFDEKLLNK